MAGIISMVGIISVAVQMVYQILLPMVLRWPASRAGAPLLIDQGENDPLKIRQKQNSLNSPRKSTYSRTFSKIIINTNYNDYQPVFGIVV